MADLMPQLGNIADIFKVNTDNRIDVSVLDANTQAVFEVLQDEMYKALTLIENAIISK